MIRFKEIVIDNNYCLYQDRVCLSLTVKFFDNTISKNLTLDRPFDGRDLASALRCLANEVEGVHTTIGPVHHG